MANSYPPFTTRPVTRDNSRCRNNTNTYTRFAGKLLFFTFFLIAIPLFPSQAPDFVNRTILNKFWELLHLMFIGIAVSYGLFGRRNVDNGNLDDSQSNVSGMFHLSPIFEDGFDHSMYYSGQGKAGFFNAKNDSFENPYEENVVQAWSSKYIQGEPIVVLAQPNCGIEKYGESGSNIDYKPLGLPVRSLKSRVGSRGSPEFGNGSSESSGSSVKDLSDSSDKWRSERFDDLGSENLEGKFSESHVLGSPIPWRARSGRTKERVRGGATRPSHFRPLSVDETQFDSLKSRSLRSTVSFSSQVGSQSHSPSNLSPSHSNSSESPKSNMSELVKERSPRRSFPPTSSSIPKPMSSKASVTASHSRQYSDGSLLAIHARKCFEDELKEFCDSRKNDSSSSKEWISGSFEFEANPAAPSKASSRGKSVRTFRTFRANGNAVGAREAGEKNENHLKGKLAVASDEVEEAYTDKSEPKIEGLNNLSLGFNRQNLGGDCYMPKPTSLENQNKEKQEYSEHPAVEFGEDSESENEDFQVSSDEETMSGTFCVEGSDTSEVDRKAGEFIAKFKEQIRLQRTTSIDTPRGLNITGNIFR
ncbi:PREDICTED: uncharacterized protein LOC18614454 [Theobroma cacao]|uniref:Uncharacterized protein LOC18614454 n=1 Tax=Theobroma cacao TaxID=3641 RepID=A0AB32VPD9_THECC|nr:PREDICTED: uncharacterized protein LOC18614454 [Theobroma cacao]